MVLFCIWVWHFLFNFLTNFPRTKFIWSIFQIWLDTNDASMVSKWDVRIGATHNGFPNQRGKKVLEKQDKHGHRGQSGFEQSGCPSVKEGKTLTKTIFFFQIFLFIFVSFYLKNKIIYNQQSRKTDFLHVAIASYL